MAVPTLITELSTTAANNPPDGTAAVNEGDNHLRAQGAFIAQLNANKLDKTGSVVPTANQPMGGYKHTGAGDGSAAGQPLIYGQTTAASLGGSLVVGGTLVNATQQIVGETTANLTNMTVDTGGSSGRLCIVSGVDITGASFSALYLLTTRVVGGSGTQFAATLIARGGSASPTLSFAVSGTNVQLTTGAAAGFTYVATVGY